MGTEPSILGHSYFHFEDLQLSSKEFYTSVEDTLKSFEYPNLSITHPNFSESGMFSANREYLCIKRKEYLFYVCAAPFGRSFFVSWWLKEQMSMWQVLLNSIPFIGARLGRLYSNKTFFQIDTEILFKESIRRVVNGVVEEISQSKGKRYITSEVRSLN